MLLHFALPEFNQSLLDFFNLIDSRLVLTLPYDSLNLVISALSSGLFAWHSSGERKSRAPQQSDCVARTMSFVVTNYCDANVRPVCSETCM